MAGKDAMADINAIIRKAEEYDVITFDVFDTLVIRDVLKPSDVFKYSYGSVGKYIRIFAEAISRKKTPNNEVSLFDIERDCLFPLNKELAFESRICRANPEMLGVYKELCAMGKKMYAISDMYLDSDFISSILKREGYDLPVIVSSEKKCNKKDGKLFKIFLKQFSYSPKKVLHIGDDMVADIKGASKAGIESVHIKKHKKLIKYIPYNKKYYELAAFVNHGLNDIENPVEQIGYEVVGPLVLAFCQWVHKKAKENRFNKLFFLARDMHFVYDVYKTVYNDDVHYLRVSRKSLRNTQSHPDEFCRYLKKEGCFGNVAIVDTGWVGVAQTEIEKYSKRIDKTTDVGGLYIGTKLAYRLKKRSKRSFAFLYSSVLGQLRSAIIPPFMETLIGNNEEQVVDYYQGEPVFDREICGLDDNMLKVGAKRFVNDWVTIKKNKEIDGKTVRKAFENLLFHPHEEDVDAFGNMCYEDLKSTKIVSYDDNCPYYKHPVKWMSNLSDSAWKGAYYKKSSKIYPVLMILCSGLSTTIIELRDIYRTLFKSNEFR